MPQLIGLDFETQVAILEDGCHVWLGSLDGGGYGQLSLDGQHWQTHRLAWYLKHGSLPPRPLELDHTCRKRSCMNVLCLEPVTSSENHRRGELSRCRRPDPTKCGSGKHDWIEENLDHRKSGSPTCRLCRRDRQRKGA